MKSPTKKQKKQTAHHEAGHTIAALEYELLKDDDVSTIVPSSSQGTLGHVMHGNPLYGVDPEYIGTEQPPEEVWRDRAKKEEWLRRQEYEAAHKRELAEKAIVVSIAGYVAERRFNPKSANGRGSHDDFRYATEVLDCLINNSYFFPEERRPMWQLLEARAKALIKRRWPAVRAVAVELLRREELRGAEVKAIARAALSTAADKAIAKAKATRKLKQKKRTKR